MRKGANLLWLIATCILLYFLVALVLLESSFAQLPAYFWLASGFIYLAALLGYHFYFRIFPYEDRRRYLALAEIGYLFVLVFLGIDHQLFWFVVFVQLLLVLLASKRCPELPVKFLAFYACEIVLLCSLSAYWQSEGFSLAMVLLAVARMVELFLLGMVGWYVLDLFAAEQSLKSQAQAENAATTGVEQWLERQRIEKKSLQQRKKWKQQREQWQSQLQEHQERWQEKWELSWRLLQIYSQEMSSRTSSRYQLLLQDIQTILFSQVHWQNLAKQYHLQYCPSELLEEHFTSLSEFQPAIASVPEQTLQIRSMGEIPSSVHTPLFPVLSWTVFGCLCYLWEHHQEQIKVVLSYHNQQLYIKGVTAFPLTSLSSEAQGVRCPGCEKKFRSLFQSSFFESPYCSNCMKEHVEKKIRQDWESHHSPRTYLRLAKEGLAYYQLGQIHYGIHNWEEKEYALHLVLNDEQTLRQGVEERIKE